MRRGDVVIVAASGDYGKPRPAVIIQTDALPATHESVVVCQLTTDLAPPSVFRLTIAPTPANGLHSPSQIMADKPVTVRRSRVAARVGRLAQNDLARLDVALAFVMGLAD
ncbi:MAG TPA: type II toxin-antitoxin system PemK/MazF family toxin [Terriglobales bacterium]|jgi:mRNA interferase MazF